MVTSQFTKLFYCECGNIAHYIQSRDTLKCHSAGANFSGDSIILIDRKTGRPTGFKSVKSVEVVDGNWRLYSLIGQGGENINSFLRLKRGNGL